MQTKIDIIIYVVRLFILKYVYVTASSVGESSGWMKDCTFHVFINLTGEQKERLMMFIGISEVRGINLSYFLTFDFVQKYIYILYVCV